MMSLSFLIAGLFVLSGGSRASCPYIYPSAVPACAPNGYECNTESAATNNVECLSLDNYCKPFVKGSDEGTCIKHKTQSYSYGAPCITSNATAGTRAAIIASGARPVPLDYLECENTATGLSCSGNIPATSTSSQPYPKGVGTCVAALSGAGDACRSNAECPANLQCKSDGTCQQLQLGDACDAATELFILPQCGRGLYCDVTGANPVCAKAKVPGTTCLGLAGECGFEALCVSQAAGESCVAFGSLPEGAPDDSVDLEALEAGPGAVLPSALCESRFAQVPPGGVETPPTCVSLPAGLDSRQYQSCEGSDIGDHEDGLSCQCFPDGQKHWQPMTGGALLKAKNALVDCLVASPCPGGARLVPATLDLDPPGGDVSSLLLPVTSCEYFACFQQLQQASCAASSFESSYAYFASEATAINTCAGMRINATVQHTCNGGLQCQNLPGVSGLKCPSGGKRGVGKGAKAGIGATVGVLGAAGIAGAVWWFGFRGGAGTGSYSSITAGAGSAGTSSGQTASGFASVGGSNPF